jgi:hypothetical protein
MAFLIVRAVNMISYKAFFISEKSHDFNHL